MTTTDIDHLEGLELRRRVLTLLGWEPLREASDGTVPVMYHQPAPIHEHSFSVFKRAPWWMFWRRRVAAIVYRADCDCDEGYYL